MSEASSSPAEQTGWQHAAERGTLLGVKAVLAIALFFGRWPARLILRVVAFYYALSSRSAREATYRFMRRLDGSEVGFRRAYTQILRFAQVGLDALFLLGGKIGLFKVTTNGKHHLDALKAERKSAILLGAHLGSFYAMRAQGGRESLPLYAVVFTKHAARINRILGEIDPESNTRLLRMGEGVDFMLKIKSLVEEGALIALLGDRVASDERSVEVDFLGAKARFPTGPYLLAATLKCPVYLTFGLYRDPDGYDLHCEPFAERVVLPRGRRQEALEGYVRQYAARLEHFCRLAPDNWFNFYDFWEEASAKGSARARVEVPNGPANTGAPEPLALETGEMDEREPELAREREAAR